MSNYYKMFKIKDETFIYFPASMILIKSDGALEKLIEEGEKNMMRDLPGNFMQLISEENDTREYLRLLKLDNNSKRITSVQINMINACNMRCKYCFADGGSHHKNSVMTKQEAKEIIDFIFEHISGELLSVVIIGGEPMLNMPVFEYILSYCKDKALKKKIRVRFATTTNGTLLDIPSISLFDSYNVMPMISQDSCDKTTNDYLRCMVSDKQSQYEILQTNKKILLSSKKRRAIHITITPFNKNFSKTAINFYEEGFYHVHLDFVKSEMDNFQFAEEDINFMEEQFDILLQYILKCIDKNKVISCHPLTDDINRIHKRIPRLRKCNVLNGLYAFSPEGNIYPCDVLMYDEYESGDIYAGINEDKILEIQKNRQLSKECVECWARYICGGKCFAELVTTGEINSQFICAMRQHMAKLSLYIYYYIQKNNPEYLNNYLK